MNKFNVIVGIFGIIGVIYTISTGTTTPSNNQTVTATNSTVTIVNGDKNFQDNTNKEFQTMKDLLKDLKIYENKESFLKAYFGKDWKKALQNPKTYSSLKLKINQQNKSTKELLEEKDKLLEKIKSQNLSKKLESKIKKAFTELRFDDVRELLNKFINKNKKVANDLIKAHYLKALTYIEEIQYKKAKDEFEKNIPLMGIKDINILNDYSILNLKMGKYKEALEYQNKALKLREEILGDKHPDLATSYNNISSIYQAMGELPKALEYQKKP